MLRSWAFCAWLVLLAAPGYAGAPDRARAPCAMHEPLRLPFFGDTHVHTTYSFDAWGQGTRLTPVDAYRFARGEAVGIQPHARDGTPLRRVRLDRPLDFAIVTDHAELLGETHLCRTPGAPGHDALVCRVTRRWPRLAYMIVNSQIFTEASRRYSFCGEDGARCREAAAGPWRRIQQAAEAAYDRSTACRFTSFVGFEWSGERAGGMIHRNVVFRSAAVPELPANAIDDPDERALWRRLERDCLARDDGCDVLAIPHNANLSRGELFSTSPGGRPLTREDAARRAALETLVEVIQHKGSSECRTGGSDELCGFETLPFARMSESAGRWMWSAVPPRAYVREGLLAGLAEERRLGINPFRLGLIGSTDTHLGTPGLVDEAGYPGHAAGPVSARLEAPALPDTVQLNPGGLAVVWAEENTRQALFEAMRRRETYATSGPRLVVRFFGGWSHPPDLCDRADLVARGYARGVPMGGELPARPPGGPGGPVFVVSALRDPGSAERPGTPLQRVQIVKGWLDAEGRERQRVHEVAGDPHADAGVDPASCAPRGHGFDSLCAVWRDPDFDPTEPAFYYARVLENPSCRWSALACLAHGADCTTPRRLPARLAACCDPALPRTVQERAWTSPIWYAPDAARHDKDGPPVPP